jgi:hypothetical protein
MQKRRLKVQGMEERAQRRKNSDTLYNNVFGQSNIAIGNYSLFNNIADGI